MADKTKVIVLGTGAATKKFIMANAESEYIDLVGVILDDSVDDEDNREFLTELRKELKFDIPELTISHTNLQKADVIFSTEYRRFIPDKYSKDFLMINCHGGLLPKWRGSCANAWAIMNGENEIGYTIHRVRSGMDDGEIYFRKVIEISVNQSYSDVHDEMLDSISKDVPKVLNDVAKGLNKGEVQPLEGFAFCSKFTKSMGNISSFENDSDYYVNLFRCMCKPLGTGVWFDFKGNRYDVGKVENAKTYGVADYMGIPGKIVNIDKNKIYVKTKDNAVVLSEICRNGLPINIHDCFINGNRLGI